MILGEGGACAARALPCTMLEADAERTGHRWVTEQAGGGRGCGSGGGGGGRGWR
jgi:hypothetical protein